MVVYADILFAINFSMDFLSLFITLTFLHKKISKIRLLSASLVGGIYGVLDVVCKFNTVISVILSITVSLLMCVIVYYGKGRGRFLTFYIVFWGVSATLAGFMSVFYTYLNKILSDYIIDYSYSDVYNGARFFIIASLTMIVAVIFGRVFSKEKNIKSVELTVCHSSKIYKIEALCDSGNLLTDPLSGKKVILVSENTELGRDINKIEDIYKRYIPYNTASGKGMLKGIIPTYIRINEEEISAVIAPVSNTFAGYAGCISTSLIKDK